MKKLCTLDELENPGSLRFDYDNDGMDASMCVVRKDDEVYAYLNECPHLGAPMDWNEGRFLNAFKNHIVCALHGAQFTLDQGLCVSGPCTGDRLTPINIVLKDGIIYLP